MKNQYHFLGTLKTVVSIKTGEFCLEHLKLIDSRIQTINLKHCHNRENDKYRNCRPYLALEQGCQPVVHCALGAFRTHDCGTGFSVLNTTRASASLPTWSPQWEVEWGRLPWGHPSLSTLGMSWCGFRKWVCSVGGVCEKLHGNPVSITSIVFSFSFVFINARFLISRKFKCLFSFTLPWILIPLYDFLCH